MQILVITTVSRVPGRLALRRWIGDRSTLWGRWRRLGGARPCPVNGHALHQHQSDAADSDLHGQGVGIHLQDEMADERQEDADAEDFERPLAADDRWPKHGGPET